MKKAAVFGAVLAAAMAWAGAASADGRSTPAPPLPVRPWTTTTGDYTDTTNVDGTQVVTFVGEPLKGEPNGAYGDGIRRPPGHVRLLLIRPRMNFVPELLKSIENL